MGSLFGSGAAQGSRQQPQPRDDRAVFRAMGSPQDAVIDVLGPADLYELYRFIIETYADPVDHTLLLEGAVRGLHAGAVQEGMLPLDSTIVEIAPIRESRDPGRDWAQFAARYDVLLEKLLPRVRVGPIGQAAARGMLESLGDPHATYLDRRTVEAQQTRGEAGIGVTLTTPGEAASPMVREVLPGGPGERAGLEVGDAIVAVDGNPTSSMSLGDAAQAVRGADGSRVQLRVRPRGNANEREISAVRASGRAPAIQSEVRDGVGYVRIRRFQEGVGDTVRAEMEQSAALGVRGWIVDLRGTASGGLQEMLDVASAFVGPRVVGLVVDRGQRPAPILATGQALEPRLPTVLLVDGETGSGAEVLAAAVREYGVADLVGVRTAGRVGIATTMGLPDGSAAQVTTQRILTPSGARLDGVGLEPDESVDIAVEDWVQGRDPQLARAVQRILSVE